MRTENLVGQQAEVMVCAYEVTLSSRLVSRSPPDSSTVVSGGSQGIGAGGD